MPLLGFLVLLTGLWYLKDILNSRQNRSSKNILVSENAVERVHAWTLLAPSYGLLTRTVALPGRTGSGGYRGRLPGLTVSAFSQTKLVFI